MTTWYVVTTAPRAEERAKLGLEAIGVDVYLPRATRWARVRRKKGKSRAAERVSRPAFPRYLFVGVEGPASWMAIRAVDGVTGVLCHDHVPVRLRSVDVDDVRCAEDMGMFDETVEPRRLVVGDRVMLTFGPMEGYVAVVARDQRGARPVEVEVELFGRPTTTVVPLDKLKVLA